MSSENDVPIGDSSRYYEQQFGDRVRNVAKPGGQPNSSQGGGSGAGWWGGSGAVIFVIVIILRIVFAAGRVGTGTSTTYQPPPQVKFDQKKMDDILRQMREAPVKDNGPGVVWNQLVADDAARPQPALQPDDLPFPPGLCYRIVQEHQRGQSSPGKRIYELLDRQGQDLMQRVVEQNKWSDAESKTLVQSLNTILLRVDFYGFDSFDKVELKPQIKFKALTMKVQRMADNPPPLAPPPNEVQTVNRELLEASYPEQVIPFHDRLKLDQGARNEWLSRARDDLDAARREFGK